MSWLTRRLDHIGSAASGGAGGLVLSQGPAFTNAYLQRLGGHIDEARNTIQRVASGEVLPWLGETERERALEELTARLETLEALRTSLLDAPVLLRPLRLITAADWSIARSTAEAFVPAVPLSPAALLWTLIGIVLAALAWDSLKIPFWARTKIRERRATKAASPTRRKTSGPRRRVGAD